MSNKHYNFDSNIQNDGNECNECSNYEMEIRNLQHRLSDNRKDTIEIQKMYEEVCKERDGWISEYRSKCEELERLKLTRDRLFSLLNEHKIEIPQ